MVVSGGTEGRVEEIRGRVEVRELQLLHFDHDQNVVL